MAKDNGGQFLAGFVLGGLVGAALAIIFAPQPGDKTVAMLREKGAELKQRFGDMTPEEARKLIAKGVKEAIEEGKLAAQRTKEEMLSRLEQEKTGKTGPEAPSEEIPLN